MSIGRMGPRWRKRKHPPTLPYPKPTTPYGGLLVAIKTDELVMIVREVPGQLGRAHDSLQGSYWVMPAAGGRMTVKFLTYHQVKSALEAQHALSQP